MIDDNTFCKFVNNELLREEMIETEKELIANGEGGAILNASVLNFQLNGEEFEDLLGVVSDEVSQINKIKMGEKVEFVEDSPSIQVTDKLSSTKNNKTMENYSKKSIKSVITGVKNHQDEIKQMLDDAQLKGIDAVAREYLVHSGVPEVEVKDLIGDIKAGLAQYDQTFSLLSKGGSETCINKFLEDAVQGKTEEERRNILATLLTTLKTDDSMTVEDVEKKQGENLKKSEKDLKSEIEASLKKTHITKEQMRTLAEKLNPKDAQSFKSQQEKLQTKKDDYKLITAIWLYVNRKDILLAEDNTKLSNQAFGALASMCVESIIAHGKYATSNKTDEDLDNWQQWLEWILLAGYLALMLYACVWISVGFAIVVGEMVALFGTSLIAVISIFCVSIYIGKIVLDEFVETSYNLMEYLMDLYREWIGPITDKTVALWQEIKEKFGEEKEAEQNRDKAIGQKETANIYAKPGYDPNKEPSGLGGISAPQINTTKTQA